MSYYLKLLNAYREKHPGRLPYTPQFRLRVHTAQPEDVDGLAMRIADPLWMLGRQWQFGEFQGEDNGSPIGVQVHARKESIDKYRPYAKTESGQEYTELPKIPLEALIEQLPNRKPTDLKSKVRIGQQFERMLYAALANAKAKRLIKELRIELPLQAERWGDYDDLEEKMDEQSKRFFRLMGGEERI